MLLGNNTQIMRWTKYSVLLISIFSLFIINACSGTKYAKIQEPLRSSYIATDILVKLLKKKNFNPDQKILAASFVNIDNLKESSTLGRVISEQVSSRLAQHNYKIIEIKLRQDSVFIKEGEGEFILTRELQQIGESYQADAVLVGTYAVSEPVIFVSARLVDSEKNIVIGSYDYQIQMDYVTESLLNRN